MKRKPLAARPLNDDNTVRMDLGKWYGVFDVPKAVADYIEDLAQENYSIQTRVAEKIATAEGWGRRPMPRRLSESGRNY